MIAGPDEKCQDRQYEMRFRSSGKYTSRCTSRQEDYSQNMQWFWIEGSTLPHPREFNVNLWERFDRNEGGALR
jgi:hypothetical protein